MICPIGTDVERAARLLREGGLVAFATETVYGLGGNALDPRAVARIFEVKGRPRFDPLIVHLADASWLGRVVPRVDDPARELTRRFWPGPLTLVLPKTEAVPDLVTSGLPTVAVRVPGHPLARELCRQADVPVAAPSANLFGRLSPTSAADVAEQLGDRIDYILDGGPCRIGVESTVLSLATETPVLLRPGGLPLEEIELVVGPVTHPDPSQHPSTAAQPSPGMLPRHYAPRTPVEIGQAADFAPAGRRTGLLTFTPGSVAGFAAVEALSPTGDLTEAAANFFAAMRRLDAQSLDLIVAELFPEHGLGRALNDRLRRAAER
jgi:L-threonylcarbamoyladenylate synthase